MRRLPAPAKLNLALVVGPRREDGMHEVVTVLQRISLADRISIRSAGRLEVQGFSEDTLVRDALIRLAETAGIEPCWSIRIDKKIPIAAGLGGGSSDAATALRLANETLEEPLEPERLHQLAAQVGADVPSFLAPGPQLGEGDGRDLRPVDLPQDYWALVLYPRSERKDSTAAVYERFDARCGEEGFEERRAALLGALGEIRRPRDLARLPGNDLASSVLADELRSLGAFRADVTGAGPAVYGLFHHRAQAAAAARKLRSRGRAWICVPTWYV
jgi:4-diphosphocytidyl-2-C-methyl-D-erythritol kinase